MSIRYGGWFWFLANDEAKFNPDKCGKWMVFFKDQQFALDICQKAIDEEACEECKCSDLEIRDDPTGVICFYLESDDIEKHKLILQFMIDNNLIRKTKTGKLYNISFKFDRQTKAGEYGPGFEGEIKLAQFVDLNTGEWIYE